MREKERINDRYSSNTANELERSLSKELVVAPRIIELNLTKIYLTIKLR